ncbi:hypothetical protein A5721_21885 [Mycobacterium vulneris]|nr:hypothetical protein A5721_21885 [Mycolicibacterium vulneris]
MIRCATDAAFHEVLAEVLRYEAPSPVQARYVARDTECLGQLIAEGSIMLLINGSANRDEAHFPTANRSTFTVEVAPQLRPRLHFCLGSSLARVQARVVLEPTIRTPQCRNSFEGQYFSRDWHSGSGGDTTYGS